MRRKTYPDEEIQQDMARFGSDIIESPNFKSSSANIQHGTVSVMEHSLQVAYTSLLVSRRLHLKIREEEMVRGALLHDYFLYDWHDDEHSGFRNLHGFYHPGVALKNASEEYELTDCEKDIIKKHMWPLTVVPPTCREAWIVTCCDKYISTKETLFMRRKTH